jgi:2'-5' RNA ligase
MVPAVDRRARREAALSEAYWRLFVSIAVPDSVKSEIEHLQHDMRKVVDADAVRWTPREQVHLTLRFLGNVAFEQVAALKAGLAAATAEFARCRLRAEGVGFFPEKGFPRVIWIGIESDEDRLVELQAAVARAGARFTREPDERTFTGHLTIGRVKRNNRLESERLSAFQGKAGVGCFGEWQVESVELMRSELALIGAKHTEVTRFSLKAD